MKTPIKKVIMDMDGVLWHGDTAMPGLAVFFSTLEEANIDYVLATNNATKTAAQYVDKLAGFGVSVPASQILTSAEATAAFLSHEYPPGTAVYIVGDSGLHQAIAAHGFRIIGPEDVRAGETAAVVVVGLARSVTYEVLAMASLLIANGARFIGTNPDTSFPSEIGPLLGAGALLAAVQASSGVAPLVIGKPGPVMFQEAIERLGNEPGSIAMIGDRLTTDIAGANAIGLQTILVLSGISTREEAEQGDITPDYIFNDISHVGEYLANGQR